MAKNLYIFDFNGTLVQTKSGEKFPTAPDDIMIIPGRKEKIAEIQAYGHVCAIASNQGGAAWSFTGVQPGPYFREIVQIAIELNIMPYVYVCFNDPRGDVEPWNLHTPARKPGVGMLYAAMMHTGLGSFNTILVSDRREDELAARNAGATFIHAGEFFKATEQSNDSEPFVF